jgi:hypothetical protein
MRGYAVIVQAKRQRDGTTHSHDNMCLCRFFLQWLGACQHLITLSTKQTIIYPTCVSHELPTKPNLDLYACLLTIQHGNRRHSILQRHKRIYHAPSDISELSPPGTTKRIFQPFPTLSATEHVPLPPHSSPIFETNVSGTLPSMQSCEAPLYLYAQLSPFTDMAPPLCCTSRVFIPTRGRPFLARRAGVLEKIEPTWFDVMVHECELHVRTSGSRSDVF